MSDARPDPPSDAGRRPGTGWHLPAGFRFGVATAGFQVEGGFNGPGQPANNWWPWELAGRVAPSGPAIGFWDRPEEALDRAASLGCDSFRLSLEWARVVPADGEVDRDALDRYRTIVAACVDRGLEPLVTLHHFTHPAWLGEDFWLRPDAPERFTAWAELAAEALAGHVRCWVTVNEINVLAVGSWLLGMFPPGRSLGFGDFHTAVDHLLTAHVAAYGAIHERRPDALVCTNNGAMSIYEADRLLTDVLCHRSAGVDPADLVAWLDERRRRHLSLLPPDGAVESVARVLAHRFAPLRHRTPRGVRGPYPRAVEAVAGSPHPRTFDVLGVDFYDPWVGRHFRRPFHATAGGRNPRPTRELWDEAPDPGGLARWLGIQQSFVPGVPLWVVENGMCTRVRRGRPHPRSDGWDRPRYLRANVGAVVAALDQGVDVGGYWHWSLVDNYEWGSYEPRFGLYGVDRDRAPDGPAWMDTDADGRDAPGAYRDVIAGLRAGDRGAVELPRL